MEWLTYLEKQNISFKVNILNKKDSILINKDNKIIYIVDGFMQKLQVFTNGEKLCTQLLYKDHILTKIKLTKQLPYKRHNYYYELIALKRTIIITFEKQELIIKSNTYNQFISPLYSLNSNYNEDIISITSHKNTTKRLIQFLFVLIERLGVLTKQQIIIPLNLSHYTIATIIGSQRITVNRIMNELKKKGILSYDNKKIAIVNIIQLIY